MAWNWCKRDAWVQIKNLTPKPAIDPEKRAQMMKNNQAEIIEHQEYWIGKVVERHGRGKKHPLRFRVRLYLPITERSRWYVPTCITPKFFMAARVKPIAMGKYSMKLRAFWRLEDFSAEICNVPQLLGLLEDDCPSSTETSKSCGQNADEKSVKEGSSADAKQSSSTGVKEEGRTGTKDANSTDSMPVELPSNTHVQSQDEPNVNNSSGEAHDAEIDDDGTTSPQTVWEPEMLDWVQIRNAGFDPDSTDKWNSQQFWVGRIVKQVGDHKRRKSGLRKFLVDFYEPFPACPTWFVHSPCSSEAYFENYLSSIEMSGSVDDDCDANLLANRPPESYRRVSEWNLLVPVDPPKKKKRVAKKIKPKPEKKVKVKKKPPPKPPAPLSDTRLYDMVAKRRPPPPGFTDTNIVTSSLLHVFGGHARQWPRRLFKRPPSSCATRDEKADTGTSTKDDKHKKKKRNFSGLGASAQPDSKRSALRMRRQWRQYLQDRTSNQLSTKTYFNYLF